VRYRRALVVCLLGLAVVIAWSFRKSRMKPRPAVSGATDDRQAERTALPTWPTPTVPSGRSPAPNSTEEQARQVVNCWSGNKCPNGTMCWWGPKGVGCFQSNCSGLSASSRDCGDGETCRLMSSRPPIYRCVRAGDIKAGDPCDERKAGSVGERCESGAMCWHGRCRRA